MNIVSSWLKAFRLRTLPLALSCIVTGSLLAGYFENFSSLLFVLAILTTIFLQILSNLANDYGDFKSGADNDNRIGPERTMQAGLIQPKAMLIAIITMSLLALISGICLLVIALKGINVAVFLSFFILGLASIAAAIKYTMGKKPYGYSGLGDVFVFTFFGLVGVIGSFYLQTLTIHWQMVLPAISIGAFSAAVLNLNNMRDHISDKEVGKNTLVVKIGFNTAKRYHFILLIGGMLSAITFAILNASTGGQWLFLAIFILFIKHMKLVAKCKDPKELDPELKKIALATFFFSLLLGIGFILSH